ncbi:hypothetical protein ABKV19_001386 [Rosa sericea]
MAFLSQILVPSSSSVKIFSIIAVIFLSHNVAAVTPATNKTTRAVFTFGDSIMDTGNNDYIISIAKSNFPPYGRDFVGGKPTGRFSNGKVPSDFAAEIFGVKKILPAYLDPKLQLQDLLTGELYALGARVIGVVCIPPIGCLPAQRTLNGGIKRACYETANQAAILFNSKLSHLIDSLNERLPEAHLMYMDNYSPLLSLIQNPAQYGFEVVDKGCCGTGDLEFGPLCNKVTPGTCNDVSKYIFWDSFHPTEKAYRILTSISTKEVKI